MAIVSDQMRRANIVRPGTHRAQGERLASVSTGPGNFEVLRKENFQPRTLRVPLLSRQEAMAARPAPPNEHMPEPIGSGGQPTIADHQRQHVEFDDWIQSWFDWNYPQRELRTPDNPGSCGDEFWNCELDFADEDCHAPFASPQLPPDWLRQATPEWSRSEALQATFPSTRHDGVRSLVELDEADFTPEERSLLLSAWAILSDTMDLAKWAVCLTYGPNRPASLCLEERVRFNIGGQIRISCCPNDNAAQGAPNLSGGRIWIDRTTDEHARMVTAFLSDSVNDRLCAVLEYAAVLYHEALHVCWLEWGVGSGHSQNSCDRVYMAGNIYRWALAQRFPTSGNSDCCLSSSREACRFAWDRVSIIVDGECWGEGELWAPPSGS